MRGRTGKALGSTGIFRRPIEAESKRQKNPTLVPHTRQAVNIATMKFRVSGLKTERVLIEDKDKGGLGICDLRFAIWVWKAAQFRRA
jgi:hypothetical protein